MEVIVFKILTHIFLSLAILAIFGLPVSITIVVAISFGTALPDADNFINYIGRLTNSKPFLGYKTVTHSMLGLGIFAVLSLILFNPPVSSAIILGYSIHIIIDLFFIEGCSLLYPIKSENRNLAKIKFRWHEELIFSIIFLSIFISYLF